MELQLYHLQKLKEKEFNQMCRAHFRFHLKNTFKDIYIFLIKIEKRYFIL